MELQFDSSVISCLDPVLCENQDQELTQELRLSDGMPDAGRVISGWAQPIVRSKEWRSDSVSMSGGLMVWVLYAPEDGTQEQWVDTWVPFQMKWDIPKTDTDGYLRIFCQSRFVDARIVSARKLMLRLGVRAVAQAYVPVKGISYSCGEVPEDVQLLKNTYPIRLFREAGEKQFQIDEELKLPGSCPEIDKLLCCTVQPQINEQRISSDKVIFRGEANVHLLYRSTEGKLHSCDIPHPFSQLAQLDAAYQEDAQADLALNVTSLESELTEEGDIRLKCGLVAQYLVDDRQMIQLVEDAYSPGRSVQLQMQELQLPAILDRRRERICFDRKTDIPGKQPVDAALYPDHPRQGRSADSTALELAGQGNVLYYDEDGLLRSAAVRWEENFPVDADADSRMLLTAQSPTGAESALTADGMTLRGEYDLDLTTIGTRGMPTVAGLTLGELLEQDAARPSLILRRAGEKGLWELAKDSGSTVDAIRRANQLDGEPAQGRMLLIPVI